MKQLYSIILLLLSFLIIAYVIVKRKLEALTLSVVDIKFKKIGIKEISGTLSLLIKNPFGSIEVSNMKLDLYIDGYYVSSLSQSDTKTELLPNGNLMAYVDFIIEPKRVVSMEHLLMNLANYGKNEYTVKGSIDVKKWFLKLTIPIDYTAKFTNQ